MGEAKRRGTYEERKALAIHEQNEADRMLKETKEKRAQFQRNKLAALMREMGVGR